MNIYIEFIEQKKDAQGRQVFFLGFDDPHLEGGKRFQVYNDNLEAHVSKWEDRGFNVIYL